MAKKLPLEGLPSGKYRLRVSDPGGVEVRTFLWMPARTGPDPVRVLARERTPAEEARYRRRRASSFSRRGDRDRAIEEMKVAVSKAPGDAGLELELAALRYSARRYSEVVEQLEPLQIELANEPDLFVLLAASSEALGRFDRALELYERALALAPDDRRLQESVARARERRP
jgi:tetratricopeptide (TPR) repeat protein